MIATRFTVLRLAGTAACAGSGTVNAQNIGALLNGEALSTHARGAARLLSPVGPGLRFNGLLAEEVAASDRKVFSTGGFQIVPDALAEARLCPEFCA